MAGVLAVYFLYGCNYLLLGDLTGERLRLQSSGEPTESKNENRKGISNCLSLIFYRAICITGFAHPCFGFLCSTMRCNRQ